MEPIATTPVATANATVTLTGFTKDDVVAMKDNTGWEITTSGTVAAKSVTSTDLTTVDPDSYSTYALATKFTPKVNKRAKLADGVISAHVKPLSLNPALL